MACTSGSASAAARSVSALAVFCCDRVGLPSALDTEAIQRRPVHLPSNSLSRGGEVGRRRRLGPELDQARLAAHLVHVVHQVS